MCQESTELLRIDSLTGLILILKFRVDTLIPNINSQTFWPQVISHVTNGIIFFFFSTSPISALFAALRIPAWQAAPKSMVKRMQEQTGEEMWQNRNLQRWTCLLMFRQVPHPRKVRLHPKVRGYSFIAKGKSESRMRKNQNPTQRRILKCGCKMHTLAAWSFQEEAVLVRPIACK